MTVKELVEYLTTEAEMESLVIVTIGGEAHPVTGASHLGDTVTELALGVKL